MNVQFKKGVLTLCVLVLAARKDRYGYELVKAISDKFVISEGTVYPLLRRLTKEEFVSTYIAESQEGPARKYYKLTEKGRLYLKEQLSEWRAFSDGVNRIIEEGLGDDEKRFFD
ncbi:PadR family transcriptional regulator [Camelliibacillus cellulosilyticus]|uniref:PadR family transcriptional regulator n=1 Tax=Camelliibacillus cellulosilyticus TaxID=2174486 RepID=A0ABV9GLT8_9BACL